tara:strand:- start:301 stop:876 length:576 start_codon:yes stop_codon:yes gene_type:complete
MRDFNFTISYSEQNMRYEAYLGWSNIKSDTNRKKLEKYLVEFKRIFKDNMRVLLSLQSQVNQLHKVFYFELNESSHFEIQRALADFEFNFNWIFKGESSRNYIATGKMSVCIGLLIDCVDTMLNFARTNKHYSLKHQSESLRKMLYELQYSYERDKTALDLDLDYKRVVPPLKSKNTKNANDYHQIINRFS